MARPYWLDDIAKEQLQMPPGGTHPHPFASVVWSMREKEMESEREKGEREREKEGKQ